MSILRRDRQDDQFNIAHRATDRPPDKGRNSHASIGSSSNSSAGVAVVAAALQIASVPAYAEDPVVTVSHYFTGDLGQKGITKIFKEFKAKTGITVEDSPIGHEDFKTGILVRAAGHNLPDVFSYWAGARTQFVVDAGDLAPIDDMWNADGLDKIVAKSIAERRHALQRQALPDPLRLPLCRHVL